MERKSKRQTSITFRFDCHPSSTMAQLLSFVETGRSYPDIPRYPDRFTLPLDSFWWPQALSDSGADERRVKEATMGCVAQLDRQVNLIQRFFGTDDHEGVSEFDWLSAQTTEKEDVSFTFRFQPRPDTKAAILLEWVRDPDTNMLHSATERVGVAFEAFWLPFALRNKNQTDSAAIHSIRLLRVRMAELEKLFPIDFSTLNGFEDPPLITEGARQSERQTDTEPDWDEEEYQPSPVYEEDESSAEAVAGWDS